MSIWYGNNSTRRLTRPEALSYSKGRVGAIIPSLNTGGSMEGDHYVISASLYLVHNGTIIEEARILYDDGRHKCEPNKHDKCPKCGAQSHDFMVSQYYRLHQEGCECECKFIE